jgi:hypothetical protein
MRRKLPVVAHVTHAPVASARALANEHVIQINVRAHAAAGHRVADHHVVQPPLGDEGKRFDQLGHLGRPVVDGLHHQRPARVTKTLERLKRAKLGLPLVALLVDHARFNVGLASQAGQVVGADQVSPGLEPLADHHRLLLPIVGHEVFEGEVG